VVGLPEESVHSTVESRIRAARLLASDSDRPALTVTVEGEGPLVKISMSLHKDVLDPATGVTAQAQTWRSFIYTNKGSHVLSSLSRGIDEFLANYLRVNGASCDEPAG